MTITISQCFGQNGGHGDLDQICSMGMKGNVRGLRKRGRGGVKSGKRPIFGGNNLEQEAETWGRAECGLKGVSVLVFEDERFYHVLAC